MRLNKSANLSNVDHLVINDQLINIVNGFKYLGSYVGSSEHDAQVRIGLASTAFAKLKSMLGSPKPKLNLKICLFKAACVLILLYGCEKWILTEAFTEKLDIFARPCYRIMLGIKQSRNHLTNERPSANPPNDSPAAGQVHRSLYSHAYRRAHQPLCIIRISKKFRLTFYPTRKHSKQLKYGR